MLGGLLAGFCCGLAIGFVVGSHTAVLLMVIVLAAGGLGCGLVCMRAVR